MVIKNKNILIYGVGKSGFSVLKYLLKKNINAYVFDDNKEILNRYKKNALPKDKTFWKSINLVVISPGIDKRNNEFLQFFINENVQIISELEFGFNLINTKNVISVTGTNGKTTTCELLCDVLSNFGKSYKCGNVGLPITSICEKVKKEDYVVIEASSFQLEDVVKFKPHIAIITNFAFDHLNRYNNFNDYVKAKLNIVKNLTEKDFLIVNEEIQIEKMIKTTAKIVEFSTKKEIKGVFASDGSIFYNDGNLTEKILQVSDINLKGVGNLENVLAIVACVICLKLDVEKAVNSIKNFATIEHRCERISVINGIEFVNDSKATNIHATLNAIKQINTKVHLLLGGSDKGENFDNLFSVLPKNVYTYLFGSTTNKMVISAINCHFKNFKICNNMQNALEKAFLNAKKGELVLLSPACASFDEFKNYEERGKLFKEWVLKLNEKF